MNLALFDFDGTILSEDAYTAYVKLAIPQPRKTFAYLSLIPLIFAYKAGFAAPATVRGAIAKVGFKGLEEKRLERLGAEFARTKLKPLERSVAREKLEWHRASGDKIVIVSGSLEYYLKVWGAMEGVQILCSRLQARSGKLTGEYQGKDCVGEEKVRRIREALDLSAFKKIYAYGDSKEDLPMLNLADVAVYRWNQ